MIPIFFGPQTYAHNYIYTDTNTNHFTPARAVRVWGNERKIYNAPNKYKIK